MATQTPALDPRFMEAIKRALVTPASTVPKPGKKRPAKVKATPKKR